MRAKAILVAVQFEIGAVEAPGFSPAKGHLKKRRKQG
jgi:hypothetical protein